MRAVIQRAATASVLADGEATGGFTGPGLVVLLGVTHSDSAADAARMASKIHGLRIFDAAALAAQGIELGESPAREVSASDFGAPILVISQFTLYGETRKGRRPTWDAAAPGKVAEPIVDAVVTQLRALGAEVSTGRFGADMQVTLTNDGPMTLIVEV